MKAHPVTRINTVCTFFFFFLPYFCPHLHTLDVKVQLSFVPFQHLPILASVALRNRWDKAVIFRDFFLNGWLWLHVTVRWMMIYLVWAQHSERTMCALRPDTHRGPAWCFASETAWYW